MMKDVEVFVPAYNEAGHIRATLTSIHAQQPNDKFHFNVLVIPNGCTDDTAQRARNTIEALPPHPSVSFDVKELVEPSKPKALNFALGQCATKLVMYVDADVTFSGQCFEQVADQFADSTVQASGAVPRFKIPPELKGTYLGQIHRVRQLYDEAAGPWTVPIGRMMAFRRDAIESFVENIAAEDAWLINTIAWNYGWNSIRVPQEASVYSTAQGNWLDYIKQESRFHRGDAHLVENFPELAAMFAEGLRLYRQRLLSRAAIEAAIAPTMQREGIPMSYIDDLAVVMKIYRDNAEIMAKELITSTGTWDPIESTKRPIGERRLLLE